MSEDKVVLSFHDVLLRKSDFELLKGPFWLNDNLISFYFQYLEKNEFKSLQEVLFITPEVTQCLKMVGVEEIQIFLDPLDFLNKHYVFLPLNDNESATSIGGSHWSLLVYSCADKAFYHFDSMCDTNYEQAEILSRKLEKYIKGKVTIESKKTPQQTNSYDCGVHVLANAIMIADYIYLRGMIDSECQLANSSHVTAKRSELIEIINKLSKD